MKQLLYLLLLCVTAWPQVSGIANRTINGEPVLHSTDGSLAFYLAYKAAVCQNTTAIAGFSLPASAAPTPACVTGANVNYGVLQFTDASEQSIQDRLPLPSTWAGTLDVLIKWRSAAIAGNVVWQMQTACVADGETGELAFNAASTITDTAKAVAQQWNDAAIIGVIVTGCAVNKELFFRFFRDPNHASDNLAVTAELISLVVTIRRAP